MSDRAQAGQCATEFFDGLWRKGDYWQLETSDFERLKYDRQIAMLGGRRYGRALEIGCGGGVFTRMVAPLCDYLLAVDVAPAAIERAGRSPAPGVEYRVANIMDIDLRQQDPWDLIVMSETIYYLGWLYSFFEVSWLAFKLYSATLSGGRLLMANTLGRVNDYLLRPWVIRTYHGLFQNVGYGLEAEETYTGTKQGAEIEALISLFVRPEGGSA
jgi:SAM-dependent methyltransferase